MRVLFLLDDIDTMLPLDELGGVSSTMCQWKEVKVLFLCIFDSLRDSSFEGSNRNGLLKS